MGLQLTTNVLCFSSPSNVSIWLGKMEGRGGIISNFYCWDQYFGGHMKGGQWSKIHHESILAPLQY